MSGQLIHQSSKQELNIEAYPLEDWGLAEGGYKKGKKQIKKFSRAQQKKVREEEMGWRKLETFARFLPPKLNLDRFRNCERKGQERGTRVVLCKELS